MIDDCDAERQRQHYLIEKTLASKLKSASKEERRHLYTDVYDELFRRVPTHPQLVGKVSASARQLAVQEYVRLLGPYLKPHSCFLEVGPGDCALSLNVATLVKEVVAVDVSYEITRNSTWPTNFKLVLSDGSNIPVRDESIDIAFSNQLMEHLHPDDAFDQLTNIAKALIPGGVYVCITPNRFSGPHDVSKYFDDVATGLHLHEYTVRELCNLFATAGLRRIELLARIKGSYLKIPVGLYKWIELVVGKLPIRLRRRISNVFPFRAVLHTIYIAGQK